VTKSPTRRNDGICRSRGAGSRRVGIAREAPAIGRVYGKSESIVRTNGEWRDVPAGSVATNASFAKLAETRHHRREWNRSALRFRQRVGDHLAPSISITNFIRHQSANFLLRRVFAREMRNGLA